MVLKEARDIFNALRNLGESVVRNLPPQSAACVDYGLWAFIV
jgi:hypothetical protein